MCVQFFEQKCICCLLCQYDKWCMFGFIYYKECLKNSTEISHIWFWTDFISFWCCRLIISLDFLLHVIHRVHAQYLLIPSVRFDIVLNSLLDQSKSYGSHRQRYASHCAASHADVIAIIITDTKDLLNGIAVYGLGSHMHFSFNKSFVFFWSTTVMATYT